MDGPVKSLGDEWQQYKAAILKLASESSNTQHLLQEITDELDEGQCDVILVFIVESIAIAVPVLFTGFLYAREVKYLQKIAYH